MTTTPDPTTVQQLATEHILDDARRAHDIGADVLGHFGPDALTKAEYHAYCDAIRKAITTATVAVSWPDEQTQEFECEVCTKPITAYPCVLCEHEPDPWKKPDEQPQDPQPWPRAQRMPLAIVGGRVQPWHHQAVAEYDAAHGETTEPHSLIPGCYTAAQVNQAITWWNERVEAEQPQDERDSKLQADLYWPFIGGADTCYLNHDDGDGYRECCMRAGLAYALKLHEKQVRAQVAAERDGDVRAVAAFLASDKLGPAMVALHDHFADRVAALDARDAKAGE